MQICNDMTCMALRNSKLPFSYMVLAIETRVLRFDCANYKELCFIRVDFSFRVNLEFLVLIFNLKNRENIENILFIRNLII